jgi:hypothetical protein
MKGKPGIHCMTPEKLEQFEAWYLAWRGAKRGSVKGQKEIAAELGISHQRVQQLCEARRTRYDGSYDSRDLRLHNQQSLEWARAHEAVRRAPASRV